MICKGSGLCSVDKTFSLGQNIQNHCISALSAEFLFQWLSKNMGSTNACLNFPFEY